MSKKEYGQFYTTRYRYILQNLSIPDDVEHIIEPFCGEGDLLQFINSDERYTIECYDIEPKKDSIIQRDTLLNPPDYNNKFILTNPPYLARNKSETKEIYDRYNANDLYKCFIKELLTNRCKGGIIIIPLNFWSSIRNADIELRKQFLYVYNVIYLNVFEEQVFNDTSYTVCSFQFELNVGANNSIPSMIYPQKKSMNVLLNDENQYTFGGEIYNLPLKNEYKITRLTGKNASNKNTNILVKCIDDNESNQINLSVVPDDKVYIDDTPKLSARTYASLIITPAISLEKQKVLVAEFNTYLTEKRKNYNSLFLTNYRESKSSARKRISFELVYNIVQYILER